MDDGATDLVKYSWYGVSAGAMNRFFYQPNYVTEQSNFRSNWSAMYTWISKAQRISGGPEQRGLSGSIPTR